MKAGVYLVIWVFPSIVPSKKNRWVHNFSPFISCILSSPQGSLKPSITKWFPVRLAWDRLTQLPSKADLLCILQGVLTHFWDDPNTRCEAVRGNIIVEWRFYMPIVCPVAILNQSSRGQCDYLSVDSVSGGCDRGSCLKFLIVKLQFMNSSWPWGIVGWLEFSLESCCKDALLLCTITRHQNSIRPLKLSQNLAPILRNVYHPHVFWACRLGNQLHSAYAAVLWSRDKGACRVRVAVHLPHGYITKKKYCKLGPWELM